MAFKVGATQRQIRQLALRHAAKSRMRQRITPPIVIPGILHRSPVIVPEGLNHYPEKLKHGTFSIYEISLREPKSRRLALFSMEIACSLL
ncbi:hypothetical protein [Nitratireductor aquimarinus]|uniref:hypothetical protein n=1 Tax=Nitratireductor aquimarinus TaxID=889300 RepID=UPI003B59CA1C